MKTKSNARNYVSYSLLGATLVGYLIFDKSRRDFKEFITSTDAYKFNLVPFLNSCSNGCIHIVSLTRTANAVTIVTNRGTYSLGVENDNLQSNCKEFLTDILKVSGGI